MRTKATLKHISQALHISISTVSRALKNHPDIAEETKKKVMELAQLMEYEPNTYAINLRTNRSKIFGLMVPEISHFFYDSFIAAIEEEARRIGYSLLILQSGDDPAIESENLRICRLNRVAGVFASITSETTDISAFLKLDDMDIPVLFFDKVPSFEACNKVCIADAEAGAIAASRIISSPARQVLALMGPANLSITRKRNESFTQLLKARAPHIQLHTLFVRNALEAREQTKAFLLQTQPPDTLFCMSDEILTGAMKAVQSLQLAIPEQVAILSISNNGFIPGLFSPEITYVETSGYELGKLAFGRMKSLMEGKHFVREILLPARLVNGRSM